MSFSPENNYRSNEAHSSESSMNNNNSSKNYVWEPYAISSPRRPIPVDQSNQKMNKKETDRDWLHAFVTYSPYRTSNQEYGAKNPMIHFIDTTRRNQSNQNDDQKISNNSNQNHFNPTESSRSQSQWK